MMKTRETSIKNLIEIQPDLFQDERGYFLETYHLEKFKEIGISAQFVQSNQSFSVKGVLRGLHFQKSPYQQGKLVKVSTGSVLDVAVDLRKDSPTFGHYEKVVLDSRQNNMLYVPEGFAHGFLALEDTVFTYLCTNLYHKASESGIVWNDPDINIDWELEKYAITQPLVSEKDLTLQSWRQVQAHL